MSSKPRATEKDELFDAVSTAIAALEEEYHCHIHFTIRRNPVSPRKGRADVTLLAMRPGIGAASHVLSRVAKEYPNSSTASLSGLLLHMATILAHQLAQVSATEEASQAHLFPSD